MPPVELPPLGMVPFLPTHDHSEQVQCHDLCAVRQWKEHTSRHGDPYPSYSPVTRREELRLVVTRGLRRYFDEHPVAERENIGSIVKRVMNVAIERGVLADDQ